MSKKTFVFLKVLRKGLLLWPFIGLLFVLSIFYPEEVFLHWKKHLNCDALKILLGLLIITSAIHVSCCLPVFVSNILNKILKPRQKVFFLCLLTAFLSAFVTNDIALLVMIPLTIILGRSLPSKHLVIILALETISANIGSALTPIGNPQNIFLWRIWGISFYQFVLKMIPLVIILLGVLLIMINIAVAKIRYPLIIEKNFGFLTCDKKMFIVSIFMLILFVFALDFGFISEVLFVVFLVYGLVWPQVFKRVDWLLLLLFALIFIDFSLLSDTPIILSFLEKINLGIDKHVFTASVLLSQVLSNVPASVIMAKFTDKLIPIAYGVNVGGNGLIWASFANLITLRLYNRKDLLKQIMIYSLIYMLITCFIVLFLL